MAVTKPDLDDFPEIPKGALLNYNPGRNLFQVYRNIRVTDPVTGKKKGSRVTLGSIKDGVFRKSATYELRRQNQELLTQLADAGKAGGLALRCEGKAPGEGGAPGLAAQDGGAVEMTQMPLLTLVLGSVMSALGGKARSDEVSQALNREYGAFLQKRLPALAVEGVTAKAVRDAMMLVAPERFAKFCRRALAQLPGVMSAAGANGGRGAERASWPGGYKLMSFKDGNGDDKRRICLMGEAQDGELAAAEVLSDLRPDGAVVCAKAGSCGAEFARAVLAGGAHYCLGLRGCRGRMWEEIRYAFAAHARGRMIRLAGETAKEGLGKEEIAVLGGGLLSEAIRGHWPGLGDGSIVRVARDDGGEGRGEELAQESYFISSLPAQRETALRAAEVLRAGAGDAGGWGWMLDMRYGAERLRANEPRYIANEEELRRMAQGYLEQYSFWLWNLGLEKKVLPVDAVRRRCRDPETALRCVACAMGMAGEAAWG